MGKKYVSEEEFIQLLNVELKKHSFIRNE